MPAKRRSGSSVPVCHVSLKKTKQENKEPKVTNGHFDYSFGDKENTTVKVSDDCVESSQDTSCLSAEIAKFNTTFDLDSEIERMFSLYEKLSGEPRPRPSKTTDPKRDEYRTLFSVGVVCDKLTTILSRIISANHRLYEARLCAVSQLTAISKSLEDYIEKIAASTKFYSFDDAAQRDALEMMQIRWEELTTDMTTLRDHDDFMSALGLNVDQNDLNVTSKSTGSSNYEELMMHRKLCEVSFNSINKTYERLQQYHRDAAEYRRRSANLARETDAIDHELSFLRSRSDMIEVSQVIDRLMDTLGFSYSDPCFIR